MLLTAKKPKQKLGLHIIQTANHKSEIKVGPRMLQTAKQESKIKYGLSCCRIAIWINNKKASHMLQTANQHPK